jgi:hypothetical protein
VEGETGRGGNLGGELGGGGETEMERRGGIGFDAEGTKMGDNAELVGKEVGRV